VDIALRYGLFVSSVIFPFPDSGIAGTINSFNIFNTYVNATRDFMFHGTYPHVWLFVMTGIAGVVVLLISLKLLYHMEYKLRSFL
jgi:ABC-type polysaccharide/polyol phosphate export permease